MQSLTDTKLTIYGQNPETVTRMGTPFAKIAE
jgi:hypothetical protein